MVVLKATIPFYPLMYERCHDAFLEKEGFRKATVKNYMLVYKVDEAAKVVIIHRFFYGAQDYCFQTISDFCPLNRKVGSRYNKYR